MSDHNDDHHNEVAGAMQEQSESKDPPVSLFIKAGSDGECVGCCPFSQRLFMILWLKGVVFNVTTVDMKKRPKLLEDIAPGSKPPFLMMKGELLTDVTKCEDFIEAELYPPRYPKLACRFPSSNSAGINLFAKFSALSKVNVTKDEASFYEAPAYKRFYSELKKFNDYLETPLDDEIDADAEGEIRSNRKFIDGDQMTMADCNMLPKLNIIRTVLSAKLPPNGWDVPSEFEGVHRYLKNATEMDEFLNTCAQDEEIIETYKNVLPPSAVKRR